MPSTASAFAPPPFLAPPGVAILTAYSLVVYVSETAGLGIAAIALVFGPSIGISRPGYLLASPTYTLAGRHMSGRTVGWNSPPPVRPRHLGYPAR